MCFMDTVVVSVFYVMVCLDKSNRSVWETYKNKPLV